MHYCDREISENNSLSKVRFYFDKILEKRPELDDYVGDKGRNVHNPQFESAVVKIQRAAHKGESSIRLSKEEKEAVTIFKKRMKKEEAVAKVKSKRASLNPLMKSMIRKC